MPLCAAGAPRALKCAVLVVTLAIATLISVAPAWALNLFELEVYQYQTEGEGMGEFEWLNSFVPKGHSSADDGAFPTDSLYRSSLEFTYGLSERVEAAAYLDLAHPNGALFQYAGERYRLRGSLFEKAELPIDLGWYAELEWHRTPEFDQDQIEVDLRPLLERDFGRITVSLNPIFERGLVGSNHNRGFEFSYAAAIDYRLTALFSPGLEFYGDIGRIDDSDPLFAQSHYILPVINMRLPDSVNLSFGAGVGLTRGSDRVIVKANLELDRFLGALF